MVCSKVAPVLTLSYMQAEHENKYFDRKSAKTRPAELASLISAFANADGGTIVIGIRDKAETADSLRALEGINFVGEDRINEFILAPKDCCAPMPIYREEFLEITNAEGQPDRLLLLHISASPDQVIRTSADRTFLRIGDKTKEMLGENLRNLEYEKGTRHFENELHPDAWIPDLDVELLEEYKCRVGAQGLDSEQVLRARGFVKERNGKKYLTNAAVLLFAENIRQFYPNCRIRFIRYDGVAAGTGIHLNITKDYTIEYPVLRIIDKAKEFIGMQLREFTALDPATGKFLTVPEYPEFAWLEGIVNAVTHREYGLSGGFIKVSMYDDRLEIESPGKLPNIVTVDNIRETRYSRNPSISRVLTEFGWVRELNEGVKRIYSDMKDLFLDEPVYLEPENSVCLVLKNNIMVRMLRQSDRIMNSISDTVWKQLDELEQEILIYMSNRLSVSRADLEKYTGKASNTIRSRLNHLLELNIITANGNKFDPSRTYELSYH